MEDIHELLVRHFSGEISNDQLEAVEKFKKDNPKEYALLKEIWQRRKQISIDNRDSILAWQELQIKIKGKKSAKQTTLPINRYWRQLAAAAIVILSTFGWLTFNSASQQIDVIQAATRQEIQLPDGTVVYLNDGSSISFPKGFTGETREVELSGEAFFDVEKNPSKPFIISTPLAKIKVLGTSFNVSSNLAESKISVKEGTVEVTQSITGDSEILTAGFEAISNENGLSRQKATPNYDSWNTGIFFFEDKPIEEVVKSLNTYYDDKIVLKDGQNCNLSAHFADDNLQIVIEILSKTCGLDVVQKEDQIFIGKQ